LLLRESDTLNFYFVLDYSDLNCNYIIEKRHGILFAPRKNPKRLPCGKIVPNSIPYKDFWRLPQKQLRDFPEAKVILHWH